MSLISDIESTLEQFNNFEKHRRLRYYYWWLLKERGDNPKLHNVSWSSHELWNDVYKLFSERMPASDEQTKEDFHHFVTIREGDLLNHNELKDIDQRNERLCFWIWCNLRYARFNLSKKRGQEVLIQGSNPDKPLLENQQNIYEFLGLIENPKRHHERYDAIISFFDTWRSSKAIKIAFIETLLTKWKNEVEPVYFLCSGREKCAQTQWFTNYVEGSELPLTWLPPAYLPEDRYRNCTAIIDYYYSFNHADAKKYYMAKLKKAWSQHKHRAKLEGKHQKSYNFVMDIDVGDMLTEMAKKHDTPKNKLLEQLIKNEYSNYLYAEHDKQKGRSSSKGKNRS